MEKNFNNRPNKSYQTGDGEIYHSRSVAVVAVVLLLCKGKHHVLLTKRSDIMMDEPGKWCLPCGYLDWDESLEQAIIREVYEETGLMLSEHENIIIAIAPNIRIDSNPESNHQNVSIATCFLLESDIFPLLNDSTLETSAIKWKSIEDLMDMDCAFNHKRVVIDAINKVYKKVYECCGGKWKWNENGLWWKSFRNI